MRSMSVRVLGAAVVFAYSISITSADALIKLIAQSYASAQLFAFAGILVAGFSVVAACFGRKQDECISAQLKTRFPALMVVRCVLGFVGSIAFYHGFRLLPLAEMFLFIGMMPMLVALLSGPLLAERVRPIAWGALLVGSVGVACLFVEGASAPNLGHLAALLGCALGAVSMVLARKMTREEGGCLGQVFWPNLSVGCAMLLALPFVYEPMPMSDVICIMAYAASVFLARLLCMVALKLLPVFVVTPLMNVQFLWALLVGDVMFGDPIQASVVFGGALVILSGLVLIRDVTPSCRPAGPQASRLRQVSPT